MKTIVLGVGMAERWEDEGQLAEDFRRATRERVRELASLRRETVELVTHDGLVLHVAEPGDYEIVFRSLLRHSLI